MSQVSTAVGSPTPSDAPEVGDAPTIVSPDQPFTNQATVDLTVNVPAAVTGKDGYTIRLYVTLPDAEADLVTEEPVGPTAVQVISGVELANGRNDFQASIAGPGGESELSAVTTDRPRHLQAEGHRDLAQGRRAGHEADGDHQGEVAGRQLDPPAERRQRRDRDGEAGKDGLWQTTLAVAGGANVIEITATDPAGNANTGELTLVKGSGKMTAALSGSAYRFRASKLPKRLDADRERPRVRREAARRGDGAVHGERAGAWRRSSPARSRRRPTAPRPSRR